MKLKPWTVLIASLAPNSTSALALPRTMGRVKDIWRGGLQSCLPPYVRDAGASLIVVCRFQGKPKDYGIDACQEGSAGFLMRVLSLPSDLSLRKQVTN